MISLNPPRKEGLKKGSPSLPYCGNLGGLIDKMKTKEIHQPIKPKKPRINVVTLGCSKNLYDSEVLMGQLKGNAFDVVHEADRVGSDDIVVINTCGFIDNAKQESIDTILQYSELKGQGKVGKVIVTGCLSERYKPELEAELTNVDAFFGTNDLNNILRSVGADYKYELIGERLLTTPSHYAYFKIAEGCNRPCSFCAIPLMRGKTCFPAHRATGKKCGKLSP